MPLIVCSFCKKEFMKNNMSYNYAVKHNQSTFYCSLKCRGLDYRVTVDDTRERLIKESIIDPETGCWNWLVGTRVSEEVKNRDSSIGRYGCINYKGKTKKASRVSYQIFKGEIPAGQVVRHTCDNTKCVNPEHLILGTNKQNSDDMVKRNRQAKGESSGVSKLTDDQVREIRRLHKLYLKYSKYNQMGLSKIFGVGKSTIGYIVNNGTWKHVKDDTDETTQPQT